MIRLNGHPCNPEQWERVENTCLALIGLVLLGIYLSGGSL